MSKKKLLLSSVLGIALLITTTQSFAVLIRHVYNYSSHPMVISWRPDLKKGHGCVAFPDLGYPTCQTNQPIVVTIPAPSHLGGYKVIEIDYYTDSSDRLDGWIQFVEATEAVGWNVHSYNGLFELKGKPFYSTLVGNQNKIYSFYNNLGSTNSPVNGDIKISGGWE